MNNTKMATFTLCTCFLVSLISNNGLALGDAERVFKVGDEQGWHEPRGKDLQFYTQWAERNRFRVGDSLLFEYRYDSVVEVEKWGYYHCNTTTSVVYFNNGKTTINLDKPGLYFFISGAPNHCKNGQCLIVDVMGVHRQRSPESYLAPSPQTPLNKSSGTAAVSLGIVSIFSVMLITIVVAYVGSD